MVARAYNAALGGGTHASRAREPDGRGPGPAVARPLFLRARRRAACRFRPSRASRSRPRRSASAATCARASTSASSARARRGWASRRGRRSSGSTRSSSRAASPSASGCRSTWSPSAARDVARTVEVRPEATTITYSHATFTVRQHVLAPLDEPGLLVLLEVDTYRPLEIVVSFRTRAAVRLAGRARRAVRVLERGGPGVRPLGEPAAEERLHRLALGRIRARATPPTPCPTRRAPSRSRSTPRGPRARWCRSRSWPAPGRGRRWRRPTGGSCRGPPRSTRRADATPTPSARRACGSTRPTTASTSPSSGRR